MEITATREVLEIGQLNLKGNIIPRPWYEHIRFANGKPDLVAITLLAEIVYWYRPTEEEDEETGKTVAIRKKFHADALQKNKQALADQFGLTERQVKEALARLEDLGLIKREYRTIEVNGRKSSNVLFIKIFPEKIKKISFSECQTYDVRKSEVRRSKVRGVTLERQTYTYTTTENTTKDTHRGGGVDPLPLKSKDSSPPQQNPKKESPPKQAYRDNVFLTEAEHAELVADLGTLAVEAMLDILSAYLGSSGKSYKSHYHTMRKGGWVRKRYLEESSRPPSKPAALPSRMKSIPAKDYDFGDENAPWRKRAL